MKPSFAFINSEVVEEVSLPLWRELFDKIGWPSSLAGKRESFTHDDVVDALGNDPLSEDALLALETIDEFGTPSGREKIAALQAELHIAPDALPTDTGERELALRLFIAQLTDGPLAELFARAQVLVQDGQGRRYNDFVGAPPRPLRDPQSKRAALEAAIREYCIAHDLGDHVQVRVLEDSDGVCRFQIMRSHHTRTPLAVVPGAASRAKIQYRPVHADLVRYEPDLGRLRITARAASIVDFYRRAFGSVLFEDPSFFGGQVCSLAVLQQKGRAALRDHNVFGVGRVWMTECVWERGDRERLHIHATDCFDTIERLGLPLSEGEILQAKFKVEVIEKSSRPLIVTVRAPSRIEVTKPRHETLANELLTSVGIRSAHVAAPRTDFWSLYPWRQPVAAWRACLGRDTDGLAQAEILKKTRLDAVAAPDQSGAGRVLQAERISDTDYVGVSSMPEIPSRGLSATDLDGLELDVPRLQAHLRDVLELTGNVVPWVGASWLLDLGSLELCGRTFRFIFALRQPPPEAATQVIPVAKASTPILLLPAGNASPTGLTEIVMDAPLPKRHRLLQDIIAAAGLSDIAPALLLAPEKARLVVDTRYGTVCFDGITIPGLTSGTQPFAFVEALAKGFPSTVDAHELSTRLSAYRMDGTQTVRHAKMAANKRIKAALEAQNRTFEDVFKPERGCFRLTVPTYVR